MLYNCNACLMTRCVPSWRLIRDPGNNDTNDEHTRARSGARAYPDDRVIFSPAEVIFDNAAARSVFENLELLCDIVKSDIPTTIGGVQTSAIGICHNDEEVFQISDIPRHSESCRQCNTRHSFGMPIVDTNMPYIYDDAKDEYVMTGADDGNLFRRRLRDHGSKSRFYTCDIALVATAKNYFLRYTTREVKQMNNFEELMYQLKHKTSVATIGLINFGMLKCPVTASDGRNTDATKGMYVSGPIEKTKHHKSISLG